MKRAKRNLYIRNLWLGSFYDVTDQYQGHYKNCLFIKVTRKGFNFLNTKTDSCILSHHLYCKDYSGIELPLNIHGIKLPCWVPDTIIIKSSKVKNNI